MITEIPTDDINFVSAKIQQVIVLSQELAKYDQGYIYLLDMADRLLQGCRERIKQDAQRVEVNS
jgi:hypothetical protein